MRMSYFNPVIGGYLPVIVTIGIGLVYIFYIARSDGNVAQCRSGIVGDIRLIDIESVGNIAHVGIQTATHLAKSGAQTGSFVVFEYLVACNGERPSAL